MNRFVKVAILGVLSVALCSCAVAKKYNPFKDNGPKATAAKGERIPVLAYDQTVKASDALAGVGYQLPDPEPIAAWPVPGGNLDQAVGNVQAAPQFQVAWKRNIGVKSSRRFEITAPPVAVDGKIFTLDGESSVTATNAKTGAREWRVNLKPRNKRDNEAFGGGLAVSEGKVFVTSGFRYVAAVDAASGKMLWRKMVGSPIHGAPTVADGRIYAVDVDNQIMAFDAGNGDQVWSYQAIVEPARILKASSPAVSGQQVIAPFSSGELVSLSTANGDVLWNNVLSKDTRTNALSEIRDIPGRPTVYRGDVYAASQSGVFGAVDIRTGNAKWQLPIASEDTPWPAGDVVFVVSKAGELVAVNRDNGQVYWISDLNKGRKTRKEGGFLGIETHRVTPIWTGPMLAGDRLIVTNAWGEAISVDAKSGKVLKTIRIGDPIFQAPIAYDGMLYLLTDKGDLVAIR
ncbi:MAG TPA: PQQ-binding-like beta-propeller repeat protein [Caulobacteraceae bacterium]|jgi:outer membrane protein assembly factor BamB|nr:PQQ-binding-like beta-propeller repeat protein [Caulobacteraceae bacterium]